MSRIGSPLKLPRLVKAAARLAREDGVSLDRWIATAVAEKIGAVEASAGFLRRRAGGATAEDLLCVLAAAPDQPPAEDDRSKALPPPGQLPKPVIDRNPSP
ncbi:MAG: pilus assembly protein HicB [Geminicoccaceae bacterium]